LDVREGVALVVVAPLDRPGGAGRVLAHLEVVVDAVGQEREHRARLERGQEDVLGAPAVVLASGEVRWRGDGQRRPVAGGDDGGVSALPGQLRPVGEDFRSQRHRPTPPSRLPFRRYPQTGRGDHAPSTARTASGVTSAHGPACQAGSEYRSRSRRAPASDSSAVSAVRSAPGAENASTTARSPASTSPPTSRVPWTSVTSRPRWAAMPVTLRSPTRTVRSSRKASAPSARQARTMPSSSGAYISGIEALAPGCAAGSASAAQTVPGSRYTAPPPVKRRQTRTPRRAHAAASTSQ